MKLTNFDRYLEDQLQDSEFASQFEEMGGAWEVSVQLAELRQAEGTCTETEMNCSQACWAKARPAWT